MSTVIIVAELLLRYGPDVAQTIQSWMSSGKTPTASEWSGLFAIARKSADEYRREAEAELDRKP
jgi:hypothetical protein